MDISEEEKRSSLIVWGTWGLGTLFFAYQYVLRVLPNVMLETLTTKFDVGAQDFGTFSGIYYVGYAILHLPVGIMLDRVGPRYVIPFCIMLCVLGVLPLIYADVWMYPLLGRVIVGAGSSGAIIGLFKISRMMFSKDKSSHALGFGVTLGFLGAMYGGQPLYHMSKMFGWNVVLLTLVIIGIALMVLAFAIIPEIHAKVQRTVLEDLKTILSDYRIFIVALFGGVMVGPLEGFADAWGSTYLLQVKHLAVDSATALPSLVFFGMCVGCALIGTVEKYVRSLTDAILLCSFVMLGGFVSVLILDLSVLVMGVLLFIVGLFCAYQLFVINKACQYVDEDHIAITTAYANMVIMVFGYVFHTSIGSILQAFWDGTVQDGVRIYGAEAFKYGMATIPAGLMIGAMGYLFIRVAEKRNTRFAAA